MRAPLIAILLVTAGFVGCIGALEGDGNLEEQSEDVGNETSESFVPPAPDRDFVGAIETDHAHRVPELHQDTHGLEQVAHENFQGFYPPNFQGGWGEVDVTGDLAVVGSVEGPLGATLLNVSDAESPEPVSYIEATGAVFDARITDGQNYVALGCQVGSIIGQHRYVIGDCGGDTTPHAPEPGASNAVSIFDISDRENPEHVTTMDTQGAHNVWTATIDGEIYVFTEAVEILHFDPDEGTLEEVANVQGTHDVTVKKHPITGDWLLYTGSPEDNSMAIYDINDPSTPSPIVKSMEDVVGWHEQTVSDTVIDGRVLLIGGGETFSSTGDVGGAERQTLHIVDVTDPANPEKLSEWRLPIEQMPPYTQYRFSAHNIDITPTGQVVTAWYHGGTWVFDLSTQDRQEDPVTLGFHQPHEAYAPMVPPTFPQLDHAAVPLVWGPQWTDEGHIVAGDLYTGVYTLEPEWGLLPGAE
jgi:hypothetical protein